MRHRMVNLLAPNFIRERRAYMLHIIDPSTFFYPTRPTHESAMGEFLLPPATITFYGPRETRYLDGTMEYLNGRMDFMPLGEEKKSIIGVDKKCRTIQFDTADPLHAVSTMPSLHAPKVSPISVPVGDGVYVMRSNPSADHGLEHCFEALIYGRGPESRFGLDWYWHWHSLPPPPYVSTTPTRIYTWSDKYTRSDDDDGDLCFGDTSIDGHALVGGSHIWVSAGDAGTYSFSTLASKWSKLGTWNLPFSGRAEYVPELSLSLGFSSEDNLLCASDLAVASSPEPPKVLRKWVDVVQQEHWKPVTSDLVPLGSGKVFIAKFFETRKKRYVEDGDYLWNSCDSFAVFTGVELENKGGELRMWKHKSARYNPCHEGLHYVI